VTTLEGRRGRELPSNQPGRLCIAQVNIVAGGSLKKTEHHTPREIARTRTGSIEFLKFSGVERSSERAGGRGGSRTCRRAAGRACERASVRAGERTETGGRLGELASGRPGGWAARRAGRRTGRVIAQSPSNHPEKVRKYLILARFRDRDLG